MESPQREKTQNDARDRQPQDLRCIGLIINSIVHSFNNAIGLIHGYADLSLKAADPDSRVYSYQKNIIDGADSLKELSEKMRVFGKQARQDLKRVQIGPIVEEVADSLRGSSESPVKMVLNIEPECADAPADAGQIRQAVINLCDNAYHALGEQKGAVEVSLKEVDVDSSFARAHRGLNEGRHLKLTVREQAAAWLRRY